MKNLAVAAVLSLVAVSAVADNRANSGYYVGGGVSDVKMRFDSGPSLDWTVFEAVGGYKHSPYVGGEVRLGYGSDDMDLIYTSFYYRTESSNETAKTYLLFGYSVGVLNIDAGPGEDDTVSLNGFSFGAGVGFPVSSRLNVNLEYRMIMNGKAKYEGESINMELGGPSINVDYRF